MILTEDFVNVISVFVTEGIMSKTIIAVLLSAFFLHIPFSLNAKRFYISSEFGFSLGQSLGTSGQDNDLSTLCDRHLDPTNLFSPSEVDESTGDCSADASWGNNFGGSMGILTGLAVGHNTDFGPRVEVEYFYLGVLYDKTENINAIGSDVKDKSQQELVRAEERIGAVSINSIFINMYYEPPQMASSSGHVRPYFGFGLGLGSAKLDYNSVFARNLNPDAIQTADEANYNGSGNENNDREELHQRIAGTTTTANRTLKDSVFGYQAIVGVDYMLDEKISVGIKGRFVKYGTFKDGHTWDQLRSHESNNGDGTETVRYSIKTGDLGAIGVSLVMKYMF